MIQKSKTDKDSPRPHLWIKDSPNQHSLGAGNIFPTTQRPPFTTEGVIIAKKFVYADRDELKVDNIYAATDEQAFTEIEAVRLGANNFPCRMAAVEKPNFKDHGDNTEYKSYILSADWAGKHHTRPKPGDKFTITMPFSLEVCPEYTGSWVKPVTGVEYDEDYIGEVDEFSDIPKLTHEAVMADRQSTAREIDAEWIENRCKQWSATVIRTDSGVPRGHIAMIISRPIDRRWTGPPELAPRVPTKIPAIHTAFLNNKRLATEFQEATPTTLQLSQKIDKQTYKDVVNGIKNFCELEVSPEAAATDIRAHLAEYVLAFQQELPFRKLEFLTKVAPPDWKKFTEDMTPHQRHAFQKAFAVVDHGLVAVEGVVAAGKSFVGERAALLHYRGQQGWSA